MNQDLFWSSLLFSVCYTKIILVFEDLLLNLLTTNENSSGN